MFNKNYNLALYNNPNNEKLSADCAYSALTDEAMAWLHHGMTVVATVFTIVFAITTAVMGLAAAFLRSEMAAGSGLRLNSMPLEAKVAGLYMIGVGIIIIPIIGEFILLRSIRRADIANRRRSLIFKACKLIPKGMPKEEEINKIGLSDTRSLSIIALIAVSCMGFIGFILWFRLTFLESSFGTWFDWILGLTGLATAVRFGYLQFVCFRRILTIHQLGVGEDPVREYRWVFKDRWIFKDRKVFRDPGSYTLLVVSVILAGSAFLNKVAFGHLPSWWLTFSVAVLYMLYGIFRAIRRPGAIRTFKRAIRRLGASHAFKSIVSWILKNRWLVNCSEKPRGLWFYIFLVVAGSVVSYIEYYIEYRIGFSFGDLFNYILAVCTAAAVVRLAGYIHRLWITAPKIEEFTVSKEARTPWLFIVFLLALIALCAVWVIVPNDETSINNKLLRYLTMNPCVEYRKKSDKNIRRFVHKPKYSPLIIWKGANCNGTSPLNVDVRALGLGAEIKSISVKGCRAWRLPEYMYDGFEYSIDKKRWVEQNKIPTDNQALVIELN